SRRISSLYSAEWCRRIGFAATSGSGTRPPLPGMRATADGLVDPPARLFPAHLLASSSLPFSCPPSYFNLWLAGVSLLLAQREPPMRLSETRRADWSGLEETGRIAGVSFSRESWIRSA